MSERNPSSIVRTVHTPGSRPPEGRLALIQARKVIRERLSTLVIEEPEKGMEVFDRLRTSKAPEVRVYAATMIADLFPAAVT
ncbi:MAG: hypothetical protein WDN66_05020 [Candidatus Saccharibacteria bacterium]